MDYYPDERLWEIQRRGGFSEISVDNYASEFWENFRFDDFIVQINCGWSQNISISARLLVTPTDEEKQYIHWIGLRAIELNKMAAAAAITSILKANKLPPDPDELKCLQAFIDSPISNECREMFTQRVSALIDQSSGSRESFLLQQITRMDGVPDMVKKYIADALD